MKGRQSVSKIKSSDDLAIVLKKTTLNFFSGKDGLVVPFGGLDSGQVLVYVRYFYKFQCIHFTILNIGKLPEASTERQLERDRFLLYLLTTNSKMILGAFSYYEADGSSNLECSYPRDKNGISIAQLKRYIVSLSRSAIRCRSEVRNLSNLNLDNPPNQMSK